MTAFELSRRSGVAGAAADKTSRSSDAVLDYRAEIDGLRAVAVVPVIFFHAAVPGFDGGFIGVDIFFVISGFLITSIIVGELRRGSFSLRHFYVRRARRLLPPLLFVMLCCLPFAWLWMLPDDLENFGQSIVATVLFSNNVLQTITTNYWETSSEFKPLLHTWSLGVEEQYYFFLPLLLIALSRRRNSRLLFVITTLGIGSFLAATYSHFVLLSPRVQAGTFYLLPTRAWELLIGAAAALLPIGTLRLDVGALGRSILALLGLGLILTSLVAFDPSYSFPSPWTVLPTLGTVLILLFASRENWAGRLLASGPLVAIGLLSYSAYLWHQPILAFLRVYVTIEPGLPEIAGAISLTFAMSAFSLRFIESPCRARSQTSTWQVLMTCGTASVLLLSVGFAFHATHGAPGRLYSPSSATVDDLYISYNEGAFNLKKDAFEHLDLVNVLILGNSFARDFVNITKETLPMHGVEIIYRNETDSQDCIDDLMSHGLGSLYSGADLIVFASGWMGSSCFEKDIPRASAEGKSIFYVGTKNFGYNLNWLARLGPEARENRTNKVPEAFLAYEREASERIPADHYVSLMGPILQGDRIPITDDKGRLLTPDRRHLTRFGAEYIGLHAMAETLYARHFR